MVHRSFMSGKFTAVNTIIILFVTAVCFWLTGICGNAASAEVTGTDVNIRSGPSAESEAVGLAGPGDTFEIISAENGADGYVWCGILLENGGVGYIRADLLTVREDTAAAEDAQEEAEILQEAEIPAEAEFPEESSEEAVIPEIFPAAEAAGEAEFAEQAPEEPAETVAFPPVVQIIAAPMNELTIDTKGSLAEVQAMLPPALRAVLETGEEMDLPVVWNTPEDYENSDRYYYVFFPSFADGIPLGESVTLPYFIVWYRPQADNPGGPTMRKMMAAQSRSLSNEEIVFEYLTDEIGFNNAIASGIMANISAESYFNPNALGDGGTSYGICQWHASRWNQLINYCDNCGYSWQSLEGQLHYLEYELQTSHSYVLPYIRNCENSAQGAYEAGYYWCYWFEIPANREANSIARGTVARDYYWPIYWDYRPEPEPDPVIHVTDVNLDTHKKFLLPGETFKLNVEVLPYDAENRSVIWYSDQKSIASVNGSGLVTAKTAGTAAVVAESVDGEITDQCTVRVHFLDVQDRSASYYTPVYWAADKKITANTQYFEPNEPVTRAQFVTFLWRLAGKPEAQAGGRSFSDVRESMSSYQAIMWASGKGIIAGYNDGSFRPNETVLRRQVAVMLWRFAGKPKTSVQVSPFRDVKRSDSMFRAVMWGSDSGIIKGSNGRFRPASKCTRAQVVTFLYRYARAYGLL